MAASPVGVGESAASCWAFAVSGSAASRWATATSSEFVSMAITLRAGAPRFIGPQAELHAPPTGGDAVPELHLLADDAVVRAAYRWRCDMIAIYRWFTGRRFGPSETPASAEAIVLRCFGIAYLVAFLVETFTSRP